MSVIVSLRKRKAILFRLRSLHASGCTQRRNPAKSACLVRRFGYRVVLRLHVVVGSGPAGVACARALLDRGLEVRMLDAGLTLEPERLALVQRIKERAPEEWAGADLAAYRAGMNPDAHGVAVKLAYGSDFAYREAEEQFGLHYSKVGLRPSLARGGLSNVWGAAVMPFAPRDMGQWPFGPEALAKHYAAVLRLTGVAASHDALEKSFPLYTDYLTGLRPSRQASQLLETMER